MLNFKDYSNLLESCVETSESDSPYKIAFLDRRGVYRPTYDQFKQIVKYQADQIPNKGCHLNEIYLPNTPVRLNIDVDTDKRFKGDIKQYKQSIQDHVVKTIKDILKTQERFSIQFIYNSNYEEKKNVNTRIYTSIVILAKHRYHLHELLQSTIPDNLKMVVKFDANSMMRSLWSYKTREKIEEEKNMAWNQDEKNYKVSDIEAGVYTVEGKGHRSEMMIQYSGFVPEDTKVLEIKDDFNHWNIVKQKEDLSNEDMAEKCSKVPKATNDQIDILLEYLDNDTDGDTWRKVCQSLLNLGATEQQVHKWSKKDDCMQYDDKARSYIDHIKDPSNRHPYGWNTIYKNLHKDIIAKLKGDKKEVEDDNSYESVKKRFELFNFKCIRETNYYNTEYGISVKNRSKFIGSYEHINYQFIKKGEVCDGIFINKWMKDPNIRCYEEVKLIIPPMVCPENVFNLWNGFDIEKYRDSVPEMNNQISTDLQFLYNHIRKLCNNEEETFTYVKNWVAYMFQNTGRKPDVMLLFKSTQGLGKEMGFYKPIASIIGSQYCIITQDAENLVGHFNYQLKDKIFLALDEMSLSVSNKYSEELKSLITCKTDNITSKGINTVERDSYTHFISFSNGDFPWKVDDNDRRYFAIDANSIDVPDTNYFNKLNSIVEDKSVLFYFYKDLMGLDLKNWNAKNSRPQTKFMKQLKMVSRDPETSFIIEFIKELSGKELKIKANDLFVKFSSYLSKCSTGENKYFTTNVKFGCKITNMKIDGFLKTRSNGMIYNIDCNKAIEWLVKNNYIEKDEAVFIE